MKSQWISGLVLFLALALIGLFAGQGCQKSQEKKEAPVPSDKKAAPPPSALFVPPAPSFEIWAADQSGTRFDAETGDEIGGGLLYIWDGKDLSEKASEATSTVIDLAKAVEGTPCPIPKRPHMLLANFSEPRPSHVILASVGSGDIFFIDVASRAIVGCVNIVDAGGIGTAKAHAANATPDNSMVIVADIAGQALHKIKTVYATNTYTLMETLNLKGSAEALGTSAAKPICHEFTADSRFAYVTMAQGGLLVVNVGSADGTTGMSVVKTYPVSTVPGIGCGTFRLPGDRMLTNGESGAGGGDDFLHIFDTRGAADGVFPDPVQIELPGDDTHGVGLCTDGMGNLFAVTAMRVSNDINVIDLQTNTVVATKSMARPFSSDPKPDVGVIVGNKFFLAMRGAKPLTAIGALTNAERTPGVAVLTLDKDCKSFKFEEKNLAPMVKNPNTVTVDGQTVSAADPHGLETVPR